MFKNIFPPTTKRVANNTDPFVNEEIRNQTIENVKKLVGSSSYIISERIRCLNEEWDTERMLEANAGAIVMVSAILGMTKNKCWFLLTGTVGCFLLKHALQGWCPPLPLIRKLGVRTADEINNEKMALKMLRRDFARDCAGVEQVLEVIEKQ